MKAYAESMETSDEKEAVLQFHLNLMQGFMSSFCEGHMRMKLISDLAFSTIRLFNSLSTVKEKLVASMVIRNLLLIPHTCTSYDRDEEIYEFLYLDLVLDCKSLNIKPGPPNPCNQPGYETPPWVPEGNESDFLYVRNTAMEDGEEDPMFDPRNLRLMIDTLLDPKSLTNIYNHDMVLFEDPTRDVYILCDKATSIIKKPKAKGKFYTTC